MATLPLADGTAGSLNGAATTNAQQKTNFVNLRTFLSDLLGTDSSNKLAARTTLGVTSAIQNQSDVAFATTGTSTAYVLTPTSAPVSYTVGQKWSVTFHTASGTAPTINISTLGAKSLKQYDSTGTKVNATVYANQISSIVHDGTDFVVLDVVQSAGGSGLGVRQTVQYGSTDSTGLPNMLSAGSGLSLNLSATSKALRIAFAAGLLDYSALLTADVSGVVSSLAANNTNYISAEYINSTSVTWNKTLAPYQIGLAYNRAAQALLHFDGTAGSTTFIDDFGNTWAAQGGAKLQSNWSKLGGTALGGGGASNALNGTTDFIKSSSFTSLGSGGWSLRGWINPSALPAASGTAIMANAGNTTSFGASIGIYNNAGAIKFTALLSSNGTSWDIANNVQGTTTPVVGTPYYVELTRDQVSGKYYIYVNGVAEATITNAVGICAINAIAVGASAHSTPVGFLNGYIDEFEFLPYCDHPNGTTYSVPTSARDITVQGYASDFFSIPDMTMYQVTGASTSAGTNPTFTAKNRVYTSECVTGVSSVTSVTNYAFNGLSRYNDKGFPNQSLGFGQILQTASIVLSTTYFNTTGKPMFVMGTYMTSTNAVIGSVTLSLNGATPLVISQIGGAGVNQIVSSFSVIIPAGCSYQFSGTNVTSFNAIVLR